MVNRLKLPSVVKLRETFRYEPDTGKLFWKKYKGAEVNNYYKTYYRVKFEGKSYVVHRIIWKMYYGVEPPDYIDHINGDKRDNRIENLREATNGENLANSNFCNSASGFRGVYPQGNKWKVVVASKYIGLFDTAEEAKEIYDRLAREKWGVYKRIG